MGRAVVLRTAGKDDLAIALRYRRQGRYAHAKNKAGLASGRKHLATSRTWVISSTFTAFCATIDYDDR